ncbi:MAG TPA: hypothetical protein VLT90_08355 [Terriglobales bacterium]|nr:hypothetical protein [Terriglobales bacterium]
MARPRTSLPLSVAGCLAALMVVAANAQTQAADSPVPSPVAYASISELNTILSQVQQTSQNIQTDLDKTRVEKWKVDSATKKDVQGNVESIRRNLQSALPEIVAQLNNAPEDLAASFKLYRNLDALYDVLGPVVESAGAFGSKDEYQSLSNDISALQSARRSLGDRMQNLASAKEGELARLRSQIKAMQSAPAPAPPKKVVVDDTEPPKKPVKKKPAKPATQPATTTAAPPSAAK